jgi:NAD(P)-dependent dehydrogenase (short-subunit alcohol dehydrogenase family)
MSDEIRYDGQVVIVTGGGRGIGRAYCLEFARKGASVVVNDIDAEVAGEVVAAIEAEGGTAAPAVTTISTVEGGQAVVDVALERFGTVDVVINNAGISRPRWFGDFPLDEMEELFGVHVMGVFHVMQPAWRVMKAKHYGRVILVSSISGMMSHGGLATYAAAKAGMYGLMKSMASEGLDHGINVNAILPLAKTAIGANDPIPYVKHYFGDIEETVVAEEGRRKTELVAYLASFLCSRECDITGEAYSNSGGRYARVFVGVADGWLAETVDEISAEAIRDHIDEVRDLSSFSVPRWAMDEIADVGRRVRALHS